MLRNKAEPKRRWLDLAPGDPGSVVAGKDKGKQGEVLRTLPDKHKIVVKGINIMKRHTKAGRSRGGVSVTQGGVIDFEAALDYSNVMLVCPSCSRPTRTKHTVLESGARPPPCPPRGGADRRARATGAARGSRKQTKTRTKHPKR